MNEKFRNFYSLFSLFSNLRINQVLWMIRDSLIRLQNQKYEGGQRKMSKGSENINNCKVMHLILTTEKTKFVSALIFYKQRPGKIRQKDSFFFFQNLGQKVS